MSQSTIQRSLAGGEIAPSVQGRADQTKYQTGLKRCRNFVVMKHGGIKNREGTQYIAELKDSSIIGRLLKFVYNADQTYLLVAQNQTMRFIRNAAQITVSGVAAYNGATAYVPGDLVSSGGVNYYCKANTTGNAPPNATYWHPLTGSIYEIPTPYATADLGTLQQAQSADVVTVVHPTYAIRELARTGHTAWTLSTVSMAPSLAAPTGVANSGAAGTTSNWIVTAVKSETYEESLASSATTSSATPSSGSPITITWTNVSGAVEYNVYRRKNGIYGFIGVSADGVAGFSDNGIDPDTSITPPIARDPFASSGNYPSTVGYYQQRRLFANTNNAIEKIWGSRSGMFKNFSISSPLQDDDAVTFSIAGRQVNEVRHLIEVGDFVVLTAGGEWIIQGDSDGVLRPQSPNPRQIGYNGAAEVAPAVISDSLVYLQARGSVLRDLRYEVGASGNSSYQGRDLTIFAYHLFQGYTVTRIEYQQIPHSIVWCLRSDGRLLGLTYLREHEVWGWHWHDTDGVIEDICVIPEGEVDALYMIVRRAIDGATKRYVERMADPFISGIDDIRYDAFYVDCGATYDGRNTGATTMTLSTGGGWTVNDTITVAASAGYFVSGDVGNQIVVWNDDGDEVKITIGTYTSATVVSGYPNKTVPAALRSTATTSWGKAVDVIGGLGHLEGKRISAIGDGNVIANPNNDAYTVITVDAAEIALDRPYMVVHVGLPITADMVALPLDTTQDNIRSNKKKVDCIDMLVEAARGIFAGSELPETDNSLDGLVEHKQRSVSDGYGAIQPYTGIIEIPIQSTWKQEGSFAVRQTDPLPVSILSLIPTGQIGG